MPRTPSELPPDFTKAAFTVVQGRAAGLSPKRLRGGDLDRPFRGVRLLADGLEVDATLDRYELAAQELAVTCDALELVLPDGAYFSHLTAGRLWPLPLPEPREGERIHVAVGPTLLPPHRVGVTGHQISDPLVRAVRRRGRLLVDPASLFCQLSGMLRVEDLVAVGDALVLEPRFVEDGEDRPWLTVHDLAERVDRFRGRGKARAARALGLVRPGAESRPESLLRIAMVEAGLPEPDVNPDIHSPDGVFLGRGDLVYWTWRVIVEYDGDQHRSNSRQYEKDVGRLDGFGRHGWRVVRITKGAFFTDRGACVARVEQALVDAGWRR